MPSDQRQDDKVVHDYGCREVHVPPHWQGLDAVRLPTNAFKTVGRDFTVSSGPDKDSSDVISLDMKGAENIYPHTHPLVRIRVESLQGGRGTVTLSFSGLGRDPLNESVSKIEGVLTNMESAQWTRLDNDLSLKGFHVTSSYIQLMSENVGVGEVLAILKEHGFLTESQFGAGTHAINGRYDRIEPEIVPEYILHP